MHRVKEKTPPSEVPGNLRGLIPTKWGKGGISKKGRVAVMAISSLLIGGKTNALAN